MTADINRNIEEVIKVDQTDEYILEQELREYVVTPTIKKRLQEILERYQETLNKPHERIGIWVSGFFGSGKSSFAKYLVLLNRLILGQHATDLLIQRVIQRALTPKFRFCYELSTNKSLPRR
ncbi:MAG: hypothetical protein LM550_16800 [Candidatus Contendobacter sp.]|jgi:polynucleotide 5'-kinase involved in rRNA processing|nr:hypothetical protein [Gammaproteobacteria bacterium]MCC8995302.1 hypothetical protein [Candidatus Contendobacter sp.]